MYYYLYLLSGTKGYRIGFSWSPEASFSYWVSNGNRLGFTKLQALSNGLPLELAWELKQQLDSQLQRSKDNCYERLRALVQVKEGKLPSLPPTFPDIDKLQTRKLLQTAKDWRALGGYLSDRCAGRQLLYTELQALLQEEGKEERHVGGALQYLWEQGELKIIPAVTSQAGELRCQRCGSTETINVGNNPRFKGLIEYTCEECITLGKATSGTLLFSFRGQGEQSRPRGVVPRVQLQFPLTPYQKRASAGLLGFLQSEQRRALVFAVCGAGKTEVSYQAIAQTLARGGRVLIAIPRKDVVRELGERLKSVFVDTTVVSIYGGSGSRFAQGDIYVATTHQVLRFKEHFDLVVLDEVDAFPYRATPMLQRAIEASLKPEGKLIYMSATPDEALLRQAERGELSLFRISRRHHKQPLPVPQFVLTDQLQEWYRGKAEFPQRIIQTIWQAVEHEGRQIFVFVPTIDLADKVARAINESFRQSPYYVEELEWAIGVHAKDGERDQKVQTFAEGKFPVVVTTSILERGVTIERTHAMVLFTDWDKLLDWGALVQMAGRVGRTTACPDGKVWFIGAKVTPAMQTAKRRIEEMNGCVD